MDGALTLENDFDMWDSSPDEDWWDFLVWMTKWFGAPPAVVQIMRKIASEVFAFTANGHMYSRVGSWPSGLYPTYLFNSIMNGLFHIFMYSHSKGIPIARALKEVIILLCGDDVVMRYFWNKMIDCAEFFALLGLLCKCFFREDPTKVEFCSSRLYPTDKGWTFIPKVGRVLARFGVFVDPPANVDPLALVKGVCLGLLPSVAPCPPLAAFVEHILKLCGGIEAYEAKNEVWRMNFSDNRNCRANSESMLALNNAYDWDWGRQREWEEHVHTLALTDTNDHPYAEWFADTDTQGTPVMTNKPKTHLGWSDVVKTPIAAYDWSISGKQRNKNVHALTGNSSHGKTGGVKSNKKSTKNKKTPSKKKTSNAKTLSEREVRIMIEKSLKNQPKRKEKSKGNAFFPANVREPRQYGRTSENFETEFTLLTIPGGTYSAGQLLSSVVLDISSMGQRMKKEASMWSQFTLKSLTVSFKPNQPDNQAGRLLAFIDPDPDVSYTSTLMPGGSANIQTAEEAAGRQGGQVFLPFTLARPSWSNHVFATRLAGTRDLLFTTFGTLVVLSETGFTCTGDIGKFMCHVKGTFSVASSTDTGISDIELAYNYSNSANQVDVSSGANTGFCLLSDNFTATLPGAPTTGVYNTLSSSRVPICSPGGSTGSAGKGYALKPGDYEIEIDLVTSGAATGTNPLTIRNSGGVTQGDFQIGYNPTRSSGTFDGTTNTNNGLKLSTLVNVVEDHTPMYAGALSTAGGGTIASETSPNNSLGNAWSYVDWTLSTGTTWFAAGSKLLGTAIKIRQLFNGANVGVGGLTLRGQFLMACHKASFQQPVVSDPRSDLLLQRIYALEQRLGEVGPPCEDQKSVYSEVDDEIPTYDQLLRKVAMLTAHGDDIAHGPKR